MRATSSTCRLVALCSAVVACGAIAGCSRAHYRKSADKEVYKIIEQKQAHALGAAQEFNVEQPEVELIKGLPQRLQPLPGTVETEAAAGLAVAEPAHIMSLNDAIRIAIINSRAYQSRKEDVYLTALALTLERHQWTPRFQGILSGRRVWSDDANTWVGDTQFGVRQLVATGASISLDVTSTFLRHITGDPREAAASALTAQIIQPLWRGAGSRIAQENLRQAERDVIYAVRDFAQYNRTFLVSIATSYYLLLQQRDVVGNEWRNFQRLTLARERAEMLANAGRLPEFQVDQAKQDELRAKDRWIRSVQQYRQALDQFKIDLGLPTQANVDVDVEELRDLMKSGIIHPAIGQDAAVEQALALRLDLMNAQDMVADAVRRVEVAANGLAPDVDLVFTANVPTETNRPAAFRFDRGTYAAGVDVGLPLDRKAERNTFRRALIFQERAERNAEALSDTVKFQVRQDWRRLNEARESYEIQLRSLALAERRVESTTLLLQAGRASTRDLLDSQSALLEAQNALIRTLVDHTVARLQLWRDIGTLELNPEGELEEQNRDGSEVPEG